MRDAVSVQHGLALVVVVSALFAGPLCEAGQGETSLTAKSTDDGQRSVTTFHDGTRNAEILSTNHVTVQKRKVSLKRHGEGRGGNSPGSRSQLRDFPEAHSQRHAGFFDELLQKGVKEGMTATEAALHALTPLLKNALLKTDIVRGLLKSNTTRSANKHCVHHLIRSVEALVTGQKWALKMFDAWGKPGPGLVRLYGIFRGEYLECKEVEGPIVSVGLEEVPQGATVHEADIGKTLSESMWRVVQRALHLGGGGSDAGPEERTQHTSATTSTGNNNNNQHKHHREDGDGEKGPLFRGKYCHFGVSTRELPGHRTGMSVPAITLGPIFDVCVPDTCNADDVTQLINYVYETATFHTDPLEIVILEAQCQEREGWRPFTVFVLILVIAILLCQAVCTAYDVIYIQRPLWRRQASGEKFKSRQEIKPGTVQVRPSMSDGARVPLLSQELEDSGEEQDGGGAEEVSLAVAGEQPISGQDSEPNSRLTRLQETTQLFSAYTNVQRLLDTELTPQDLTCLHGLRFFCTAWVVLGDLLVFQMIAVENSADFYFREREKMYTLIIGNYLLAVNAFFVMSGVLVGARFQQISDQASKLKWIVYVIKRYLRLTPVVMVVGALYLGLWPLLGQGPVYPRDAPDQAVCQDSWFYTAFLINNYIDIGNICFPWTWYIAADFQFYLFCPIFMIPLVRGWKKTGTLAALTLLAASVVTTGVISKMKELPEMELQYETADAGIRDLTDIQNSILIKPYCRIAPYIIGLLLGHFLNTGRVPRLSNVLVMAGWLLCVTAGLATVFGVYRSYSHHQLVTISAAAVYNALKDVSFGLAVAWAIFACVTGNGGFINTLLSWRLFVPLSRLCYLIYLVHIPVIYVFIYNLEGAMTMSEMALVVNFCGVFAISCGVSAILHVVMETPMRSVQKRLLEMTGLRHTAHHSAQ